MKLLKTGILALSLTVTATVGLAADYEIFADFATVKTGVNHYSVERLATRTRSFITATQSSTPRLSN
jgi:hypothetical protein